MNIELKKASESDYKIIKNLVPYYIYDMSEYMGWDPNGNGHYCGCDELQEYWEKDNHYPYIILADSKIAGFAMVRPYPNELERTEIGDFFVLRKFKRQEIGKTAAFKLFNLHQGNWLVRVLDSNTGARIFWEKVIKEYTKEKLVINAETYTCPYSGTWPMQFFRFESI